MLIHLVSKQGKGGNDDKEDHLVLAAIVPSIVQKVLEQYWYPSPTIVDYLLRF